MAELNSLVVVANRLPIDQVIDDDGTQRWQRSPGGLVTALEPVVVKQGGTWVGWAGTTGPAPAPFAIDGLQIQPVPLSEKDILDYYEGFSNSTLWPLYHDAAASPTYHRSWWDRYVEVNHRFAHTVADVAAPGATVWIQDYQLQLVPAMLRERRPDLRIGFFLHIPFPPVELFTQLPWRTQIMSGLLGADLLGFQRPEGAQNFLRLARFLSGFDTERDAVVLPNRLVRVGSFPISIDYDAVDNLAHDPDVIARSEEIRHELGDPRRVLLGVDRLDYIKGIEQRLKAYRELLADGLITVEGATLVQVATPSRERVDHYQHLREEIESYVGRINGEFAHVGKPAVHYLRQSYDTRELVALYRAADVALVTPLRDGMNLVAKEYVAARPDLGGALVLSEFTGAASELTGAFLVNPYDVDGMKKAILAALSVEDSDGQARMQAMRHHVAKHDVSRWANDFLTALYEPEPARALPRRVAEIATHPSGVCVVSDYDGTLSPFAEDPSSAAPAPGARDALLSIAELPHTSVVVLTGRPAHEVRSLLGITDSDPIHVIGLHGFDVDAGLGAQLELTDEQLALRERIKSIIESTVESLAIPYAWLPADDSDEPRVLLEDKLTSVAVHVRTLPNAERDTVLGAIASGPARLRGVVSKSGAMVLELAVTTVNKGDGMRLLRRRLAEDRFVFLGDDVTDLDAIAQLHPGDAAVIVDSRLPQLVAAWRRGTLRPELAPHLTPRVVNTIDHAVKLADPAAAVELLRQWRRSRATALIR